MAKHLVACVACGRQFDANEGGRYDPNSRRYRCPDCVQREYDAAVSALSKKLKRRFVLKIVFGVIFLLSGIVNISTAPGAAVLTFVVGVALLAWAIIPYKRVKDSMIHEEDE